MLDDDWLEEAAKALAVPFLHKRQREVVDDVMDAVRKAREVAPGTAASLDADRRLALHQRTWEAGAVLREAKAMGVLVRQQDVPKKDGVDAVRQMLFLRCCPEDLRLRVVSEYLDRHGDWPPGERGLPPDDWASSYLQSALSRRHASDATGEQLSPSCLTLWQQVLHRIPKERRPDWLPDPALEPLQAYYLSHGNLNVMATSRKRNDPGRKLQYDLRNSRRARLGDVTDANGVLLRRMLSPTDVATWQAIIPADVLWGTVRKVQGSTSQHSHEGQLD